MSKFCGRVKDREAWHGAIPGVAKRPARLREQASVVLVPGEPQCDSVTQTQGPVLFRFLFHSRVLSRVFCVISRW